MWDERAYWASVVAVNINGTAPVLGPFISKFLLAGPVFGAQTISRFYALHMLMIPGAMGALIFVHLWLVVKLGVTPWPSRPLPEPEPQRGLAGAGARCRRRWPASEHDRAQGHQPPRPVRDRARGARCTRGIRSSRTRCSTTRSST